MASLNVKQLRGTQTAWTKLTGKWLQGGAGRESMWANTSRGRNQQGESMHYGSCLMSEASLWLTAVLFSWWDRSCTKSPKRRLISMLLLGRRMSPRLAAVERMREIPGLPHHTALLKLPQASHLLKPRSQKVRWCSPGRASGCVCCVQGRLVLELCLPQMPRDPVAAFMCMSGLTAKAVQTLALAYVIHSISRIARALRCAGTEKRWKQHWWHCSGWCLGNSFRQ